MPKSAPSQYAAKQMPTCRKVPVSQLMLLPANFSTRPEMTPATTQKYTLFVFGVFHRMPKTLGMTIGTPKSAIRSLFASNAPPMPATKSAPKAIAAATASVPRRATSSISRSLAFGRKSRL